MTSAKEVLRVLLVEDNEADADFTRILLAEVKLPTFQVETVTRVEHALQKLRNGRYDVVLLDLGLPDSVGFMGIQRIREVGPHLPVLVMTGQREQQLGVEAVRAGARDYLVKGGLITAEKLSRRITDAIQWEQVSLELNRSTRDLDRSR